MGKRAKYKTRANGYKETTKTYTHFGNADFTGKKHFYGRSDDEIDNKIAEFEKSLMLDPDAYKRKLEDVVGEWWDDKQDKISPNSISSYKAKKDEIIAKFGNDPVDSITPSKVIQWLNLIAAQGYSQRSVSDRKCVLKNIFDFALAKEYIAVNPCMNLPIVKGQPKQKRRPADDSDIQKLEDHKADSLMSRLYYFLEYTGCRIGEAIVLQEKDIDRDHHKASISKDIAYPDNRPEVKGKPKTDAGIREIDLYDNVLAILPKYDDPETYIFFPDGLPHKSALQKQQRKFRNSIGITTTAHQLRHTYAGIMHSAELDVKDTQARLGHANIAMTQDIYTEIEKAHNEKSRNKANKYIMEQRLGEKKNCPFCGSSYIKADDGHLFKFCPDCGGKVV